MKGKWQAGSEGKRNPETIVVRTANTSSELVDELKKLSEAKNLNGMARFGIDVSKALGVSMPNIRSVGKSAARDHTLAQELWLTGIHEARILASLVDLPNEVTSDQMEAWASDFNSWDLCDQVCGNLFDRVTFADEMIVKWSKDQRELVKRAAFAMIAWRVVHLKKSPDKDFLKYLPLIESAANDKRNFVKKAVNWALRQIGKRSAVLHPAAITTAKNLAATNNKTAQWVAKNALRELESEKVLLKLNLKEP